MIRYITFYKITCLTTGKTYVGSTRQTIKQRMRNHLGNYKQYKKGNSKYNKCSSYDIMEKNNYIVKVLKRVPDQEMTIGQKKQLERKFVEDELKKGFCLNRNIPNRTQKEYRETKKDYLNEYFRNQYRTNPKYKDYKRQYYLKKKANAKRVLCPLCNVMVKDFTMKAHEKTKKHQSKLCLRVDL